MIATSKLNHFDKKEVSHQKKTTTHTMMHTITCNTYVSIIAYIYIYQGLDCLWSKGQTVKIKLKGVTNSVW